MNQNKPQIGMITIGQSPRPDILGVFRDVWDDRAEMIEIGALDGLTHEDVQKMAPKERDDVLVVRMADGTQHIVGHEYLQPRIQACADTLIRSHDLKAAVLLCTGNFRPFPYPVPFLIPQKIVDNTIAALAEAGQSLGIMIPTGEQQQQMRRNLAGNGITPVFAFASPHTGEARVVKAAWSLQRQEIHFIVMHCFGYTRAMRELVKEITGKPVLLSTTLVANVTGEVFL